jgi:hypothetical protein
MAGKYGKARKSYNGKKKVGGARRAKIPRNAMSNYGGTMFPLTRTGVICSNDKGVIDAVFAVGNVNIKGPPEYFIDANNASQTKYSAWGPMLDNLRSLYTNMRVISHEIQLLPICAGTDVATTPLEIVYARYGIDQGGSVSNATALTSYGGNGSSSILNPSDNKMPSHTRTFTAPAGSMHARETYPIPVTSSQDKLDLTTGDQAGGRTFGFFKLFASDLKPSTNSAVVQYYRYVERIQVMAKDRRSDALGSTTFA